MKIRRSVLYIFFVIIFSTIVNSCGSVKNEFTSNETIFIFFDSLDNFQKKTVNNVPSNESISYLFMFKEINDFPMSKENIRLSYRKYKDYDDLERDNVTTYFKVDKNFLKNNKDIIITMEHMKSLGYQKSLELLKQAKTIFIIDNSEINDKKIIIKEAILLYVGKE